MTTPISFDREFNGLLRDQYGAAIALGTPRKRTSLLSKLFQTAIVIAAATVVMVGVASVNTDTNEGVARGTNAQEIAFCAHKATGLAVESLQNVVGQTMFNAYGHGKVWYMVCRNIHKARRA